MERLSETRTSQGASDTEKYNWLQGTSRESPIPNDSKHPHEH
jgi:hypothetical protein